MSIEIDFSKFFASTIIIKKKIEIVKQLHAIKI